MLLKLIADMLRLFLWKIKKGLQLRMLFRKESIRKLNKIWFDKSNEFYNKSMKSWLQKNGIEMIYWIPSPQYQPPFSDNSCYSTMIWVFGQHDYTCYTFKITTQLKERKALISKVSAFDFTLLIISIALSEIDIANHHRIIQLYVCYKYHFKPFKRICVSLKH